MGFLIPHADVKKKIYLIKNLRGKILRRDSKYSEVQKGNYYARRGPRVMLGKLSYRDFLQGGDQSLFSVFKKKLATSGLY